MWIQIGHRHAALVCLPLRRGELRRLRSRDSSPHRLYKWLDGETDIILASNERFQVRILVGLLDRSQIRDLRSQTIDALSVRMVSVVYAVGTPACEAGGKGSTPFGHPG